MFKTPSALNKTELCILGYFVRKQKQKKKKMNEIMGLGLPNLSPQ